MGKFKKISRKGAKFKQQLAKDFFVPLRNLCAFA